MCPHCKNKQGFVFGTCVECGYNSLDETFHHIVVWSQHLEHRHPELWDILVQKHSKATKDKFDFTKGGE